MNSMIAPPDAMRRPPAAVTRNQTGGNMSDVQHPRRTSAAERMRRSRERRRNGLRLVPVDVHDHEVAALVRLGFLSATEQGNPDAIGDALGRFLDGIPGLQEEP